MSDNINPNHYKSGGLEMFEILKSKLSPEELKGFCKGVVLQYIIRADQKNGIEDITKAQWYLEKLLNVYREHFSDK